MRNDLPLGGHPWIHRELSHQNCSQQQSSHHRRSMQMLKMEKKKIRKKKKKKIYLRKNKHFGHLQSQEWGQICRKASACLPRNPLQISAVKKRPYPSFLIKTNQRGKK